MSYLSPLRIHFAGRFTAAPSTVNNDERHYDNAHFNPSFQLPQGAGNQWNGWWNPEGDHRFDFLSPVTAVRYTDGTAATAGSDPALTFTVQSARGLGKPPGKIVDLDPQQQGVSMIFGLEVTIVAAAGAAPLLRGTFRPAAFTDLWSRWPGGPGDESLSVMYQSILESLTWGDVSASRFLTELKTVASDGILSIRFNLDGYSMTPPTAANPNPKFTTGRLVGTIGPGSGAEPRHFVRGRQVAGQPDPSSPGSNPTLNFSVALVDETAKKVRLDLGNALPVGGASGDMLDVGRLSLVCRPAGAPEVALGEIPYTAANWYENTAGVVDLPDGRALTATELAAVQANPLVLVLKSTSGAAIDAATEVNGGVHVRADQFVKRLNPGDTFSAEFYATRLGRPFGGAQIDLQLQQFGPPPPADQPTPNPNTPHPPMGVPPTALNFPATVSCDANGRVTVPLKASDPGNPRGYMDGQVYFVLYAPDGLGITNSSDFLSVLVWNAFAPDNPPTWYGSMKDIFQLYGNLYPVMRDNPDLGIDLGSYDAVCANADAILRVLKLDVKDPGYMPVSRDLSAAKSQAMKQWLSNKGPDGKPLLGAPPALAQAAATRPAVIGSKTQAARELGRLRLPSKLDRKR